MTFPPENMPEFRTIILRDLVIAAGGTIPDRVLEDCEFEVIRDQVRQMTRMYIKGVFRAELLQETEKFVSVTTPVYPSSLWDCVKFYLNEKLKRPFFEVEMRSETKTTKVTFTRLAMYPHLPSLRSEYRSGTVVMKESISVEERQKTYVE